MPSVVTQTPLTPDSLAALGPRWDAFAATCGASFFQRWTWMGAIPFPHPVLIEATESGQTVGLALAGRRGPLHLSQTGDPVLDGVFIEHNGPLFAPGRTDVCRAMLRAMRPVVLPGVLDAVLQAARGVGRVSHLQTRLAPVCDLTRPAPHSRNMRQRLARSARDYGPLRVERAPDANAALGAFELLVDAHTKIWRARGQPGAFHAPGVLAFHHAVIARGVPEGTVDLLSISAAGGAIGHLYNFRQGATVHTYQSAFAYDSATAMQRPGLSSHIAAMAWYAVQGVTRYDFMAGDSQYKRSLSTGSEPLHWLQLRTPWDPRGWFK